MNKWREKFNHTATLENFGYFIIFCLPLYLIKVAFFIPTNLLEILMAIFLIIFIVDKNNWNKIKVFFKKNTKYLVGFLLLAAGFLISTLVNENIDKGLGIIKGWIVLPFIFSLAMVILLEKEKRSNIFRVFYFSTLLVALFGLIFIFFEQTTYDGRLKVFFNSPNYLAMYLVPGALWGVLALRKKVWISYLFLAILFCALFFTYSYLAWLAIGGTLIGIGIRAQEMAPKKLLWIGMALVFIFLAITLRTEKTKDLMSLNSRSSIVSRGMIWRSAGKILSENWLWGIGPSNFQESYLAKQKDYPPYLEWAVPHPHSLYLAFWLEGGFLGIFSFLILLFWWFREYILQNKKETILGIVSLSIVLYALLHGVADTTYFKNDLSVIFWLAFLSLL